MASNPKGIGTKTLGVNMPKELANRIDELSAHFGISQSELIRQAIKGLIKHVDANNGGLQLPYDPCKAKETTK